jgi:mRNA interferase MazF
VQRGDVFEAVLDPVVGSEQGGRRPVIVVSRNAITANSPILTVVPVSSRANFTKIYPSQAVIQAGAGGLSLQSVAMAEQVRTIAKARLTRYLGHLPNDAMKELDAKLKIALALT